MKVTSIVCVSSRIWKQFVNLLQRKALDEIGEYLVVNLIEVIFKVNSLFGVDTKSNSE